MLQHSVYGLALTIFKCKSESWYRLWIANVPLRKGRELLTRAFRRL